MGTSAIESLTQITPLLLGLLGICALIALLMALGRHFLYEHGNDDLQPVSKRVTHVFGYVLAIGCIAAGGAGFAANTAFSKKTNPSAAAAGTSLIPSDAAAGGSYQNIGQLIMSQVNPKKDTPWWGGATYETQIKSLEEQKKAIAEGDVYKTWLYGNNFWSGYVP